MTNVAAYNFEAATNLLRLARSTEEGSFYWSMAAVVFAAFAYEAFLNVYGSSALGQKQWEKINRAGWRTKHDAICQKFSLPVDFSVRPASTLCELFEFRHRIAHGREEEVSIGAVYIADLRPLTIHEATVAEWEKKCTVEYAALAVEDVRNAASMIRRAGGQRVPASDPFASPSRGAFSAKRP